MNSKQKIMYILILKQTKKIHFQQKPPLPPPSSSSSSSFNICVFSFNYKYI